MKQRVSLLTLKNKNRLDKICAWLKFYFVPEELGRTFVVLDKPQIEFPEQWIALKTQRHLKTEDLTELL